MDTTKLYELDKTVVSSRLVRWGAWRMNSCVALGYQSMSAFMKLNPSSTSIGNIADEIDSECKQTDRAVSKLNDFLFIVVRNEYVLHVNKKLTERAVITGVSRRRYSEYLDRAHGEIAENLNLLLISPPTSDINVLSVSKVRSA